MKNKFFTFVGIALSAGLVLSSCEKMVIDEEESLSNTEKTQKGNVVLCVSGFNIVPFETRALVDITTYCKRLNFVIYKDGKKIDSRSQTKGDADYGTVTMSLEPDTYKLLVVAHNSNGNPSLSNPESIQFTNKLGYYDTFCYYGDIVVTEDAQTHNITMSRAASMLRFIIEDEIPSNVKYITLYYTGGSGVLNAVTGHGGNVNSQQEMLYNVEGATSPVTLPVYTFLQEDTGELELTVTALTSDKQTVVAEKSFSNVPMKHNMITEYTGTFFSHASSNGFSLKGETDWEVYQTVNY